MVICMRIDAYNAVNQVYQTNTQAKKVTTDKKTSSDKLEISQAGKDIAVAKKAIAEAPDVREDRVETIKKQMAAGTYSVSLEDVADKMVDSFLGGIL